MEHTALDSDNTPPTSVGRRQEQDDAHGGLGNAARWGNLFGIVLGLVVTIYGAALQLNAAPSPREVSDRLFGGANTRPKTQVAASTHVAPLRAAGDVVDTGARSEVPVPESKGSFRLGY